MTAQKASDSPPLPDDPKIAGLLQLTDKWREAKHNEDAWKAIRNEASEKILELLRDELPSKGTYSEYANTMGLKIVTGYTEKWDQEKLVDLFCELPMEIETTCFKKEFKPTKKMIDSLKELHPEEYSKLIDAATLTPKNPAVTVGDV